MFHASEPVIFDIRDKQTGERKKVASPRVCLTEWKDGECINMQVCKATADFADSVKMGEMLTCKGVAFDEKGRICTLY